MNGPLEAELGAGRQERSACLTTGLPGYGQGCSPRIVRLKLQRKSKKGPISSEVFAGALILGARGMFWEGFGRLSEVSRIVFTGVSPLDGQVGGEL